MDVATFASFAVGPASLALLGYQAAQVGWLLKRLREGDFVHRGLGTTDLLPYALPIEDGTVLDKNGALTASWLYTAPDTSGLAPADINEMAERTNSALKDLRSGWMLQTDLIRRPAPRYTPRRACHFTDPVCASIDEERRQLFERAGAVYQGYTVLTLSYLPTRDVTKHFLRWIAGNPSPTNKTSEALADFRARCSALEKDLAQVVTTMQRLGRVTHPDGHVEDEQLRFINFCATGIDQPIRINPANPPPMDAIVGTQDLYTKPSLRIGDHHVRCVTIDGFPEGSAGEDPLCWPTQLNLLTELGHAYRWNTRFIFLDPEQAQAEMQRTREQWKGQTRSLRDQVKKTNQDGTNIDAEKMVSSAEAAINSSRAGSTASGYYTSAAIVMHQNAERADEIATDILAAIKSLGFSGRIEDFNALETLLGSLPSDGRNIRRPHVDTDVLANLLPLTSLWVGSPTAPCSLYPKGSPNLMHTSTHGSTPHWLNCHVGDVGHTLIFGPTRAGKSVLINMIMAQLRRYEGMKIFAFDIGLSMYALTRAIHATTGGRSGQHYRPGEDNGCPDFAPLQALDTREDRDWARSWIKTILELNNITPTPAQLLKIESGLEYLAKSETRSMSELVPLVQAGDEIRAVLRQYTRPSGGLGAMFDARTDTLELSDFAVFEIRKLMKAEPRFVIPALLYLFRRIENAGTGPKAFVLDEGWAPLSHPQFRSRAEEWFKTAAKANCAVILGTQSVGDAAKSGIFETLNEQCFNKIFLPNKRALSTASDPNTMSPAAIYRSMGLTDHQIHEYIVKAVRQKHYYQFTPDGNRLFELDLGPFAKSFVAQTNIEAATKVMELEAEYGHEWVDVWLQNKGLRFLAEAA